MRFAGSLGVVRAASCAGEECVAGTAEAGSDAGVETDGDPPWASAEGFGANMAPTRPDRRPAEDRIHNATESGLASRILPFISLFQHHRTLAHSRQWPCARLSSSRTGARQSSGRLRGLSVQEVARAEICATSRTYRLGQLCGRPSAHGASRTMFVAVANLLHETAPSSGDAAVATPLPASRSRAFSKWQRFCPARARTSIDTQVII
jgi:hypothetical protein